MTLQNETEKPPQAATRAAAAVMLMVKTLYTVYGSDSHRVATSSPWSMVDRTWSRSMAARSEDFH